MNAVHIPQPTSVTSLSRRMIHAVLALLIVVWQCSLFTEVASASTCDTAAPVMSEPCPCCLVSACHCDATPTNEQPKPVLPATTGAPKFQLVARTHECGRDSLMLVAPKADNQRPAWVMDAATSGRSVPLYCRHCSRLI